ncbi:MAG: LLM class flavin-dependent oxidoreductase [Xanthobacteraceae bacterium]
MPQSAFATNPLFSNSPLKLGSFSTNLSGGGTISKMEGLLKAEWPATLELARLADEMKFEAIVPVGRWKGFGGETNFNGEGFEVFAWAAGLTSATHYSSVFATSHIPTVHPLFAAKQAAAIDHIGNGRFTLNLVTGWYTPEMDMFGITLLDHDSRYEMAEEWVQIATRLWSEPEPFDFSGRFYQMKQAELAPKPIQRPRPPLMSAAGSDRGRRFAANIATSASSRLKATSPANSRPKSTNTETSRGWNSGARSRSGRTLTSITATRKRTAKRCGNTLYRNWETGKASPICSPSWA